MQRVLPEVHKKQLKLEGGDELAAGLSEYWDDNRGLFIKHQLSLSETQYSDLRDYLTKRYDTNTATYVPLVINGSVLEALPSNYFLDKREGELLDSLGIEESKDGRFAKVNLLDKLVADIREHLRLGELALLNNGVIVGAGGSSGCNLLVV